MEIEIKIGDVYEDERKRIYIRNTGRRGRISLDFLSFENESWWKSYGTMEVDGREMIKAIENAMND